MPPVVPVLPLHLGALHPVEQLLTFVLAFGPFVVLGVVIWVRRRADAAEDVVADARERPDPALHADGADAADDHTDDQTEPAGSADDLGSGPGSAGPAEVRAQRER